MSFCSCGWLMADFIRAMCNLFEDFPNDNTINSPWFQECEIFNRSHESLMVQSLILTKS